MKKLIEVHGVDEETFEKPFSFGVRNKQGKPQSLVVDKIMALCSCEILNILHEIDYDKQEQGAVTRHPVKTKDGCVIIFTDNNKIRVWESYEEVLKLIDEAENE